MPKDKDKEARYLDVRKIENALNDGRWVLLVPWREPLHRDAVMMAMLRTALGIERGPRVDLLAAVEEDDK